jgi:hypothetical protein
MEELYRRPQLGEASKAIDANGFTDWLLCAFPSPFLRPSNHTYIKSRHPANWTNQSDIELAG